MMTLFIGVTHSEEYLEDVINRLSFENLKDKKTMLEVYSFPVSNEVHKRFPKSANFWEGVGVYIQQRGGLIIPGGDKSLFYETLKEMQRINESIRELQDSRSERWRILQNPDLPLHEVERLKRRWKDVDEESEKQEKELWQRYHTEAPFKTRDSHFSKVISEKKPDIVLIGHMHIPYLIKHNSGTNYSLVFIPKEIVDELYQAQFQSKKAAIT